MTTSPEPDAIDRVRAIANVLPEVGERVSEGQPTFFVGDTPFAQVRIDHHGDGHLVVCVRASDAEEAATLIEANPGACSRAADPGAAEEWVAIDLASDADWTLIEDRIARSWELAAPRRLLEAGGR